MISYPVLNWLPVVAAGIAAVVLSSIWYAPPVFGRIWLKALGWTEADAKERQKAAMPGYGLALVGALLNAFVMAVTVKFFGATSAIDAIWVASLMWVGYIGFTQATAGIFEGRPWSLTAVNTGNALANQVVIALIVTLWV